MDRVKKAPVEGLVEDVDSGEDKEPGFDERREIFKVAVAVWVAFVSRLVGDADREKRNDGGDEVEAGMQRFREDAEAVGADDQESFQAKEESGRANAQQGGALLFLDGGMQALGKDHELRLQHLERGRRTGRAGSVVCILWLLLRVEKRSACSERSE